MCVAILKYKQREIMQHQQQQDLIIFLKVGIGGATVRMGGSTGQGGWIEGG